MKHFLQKKQKYFFLLTQHIVCTRLRIRISVIQSYTANIYTHDTRDIYIIRDTT